MKPIPAEDFSEMIGSIYDCALDSSHWPATLAMLRGRMDFANVSLDSFDIAAGRVVLNIVDGMDLTRLAEMEAYGFQMVEQWGGFERVQRLPLDEPLLLSRINPAGLTRENRFYEQFDEPEGIVDVMTVRLARDREAVRSVAFGRHRDQGPIGVEEIACVRLFAAHLSRAVTISHQLEVRAVERATFAAVLDSLTVAVLLVASDLKLLHANRAGEAMLRTADPLGLRNGRVSAANGLAAALQVALAAPLDGIGRRGLGIPARRSDGEELVLHVLPLAGATPLQGATAALFLAHATSPRPAPTTALAALFGLTPAESRVLELIGVGRESAEIAQALGVAISTVRTHVLRLFDKTRTGRQAELVSLVAAFSLPLA